MADPTDPIHPPRDGVARRPSPGRWIESLVVIAAIAVAAGIATADHFGLLGASRPQVGPGPGDWQTVSLPAGFEATGISCTGPDDCWLLGARGTNAASAIWRYGDGTWTSVGIGGPGYLLGLTCVGADDCWAVGDHFTKPASSNSDGVVQPLIEHSAGSRFGIVSEPRVEGDADNLDSVSCVGADDCWATGSYAANSENGGDGILHPLVEHFDGSAWTVVTDPGTEVEFAGPGAVACTGSDDCWGFGPTTESMPLQEFDGATWVSAPSSPRSTLPSGDSLGAAACRSPTDCWAVGSTGDATTSGSFASEIHPLAARFTGGGWTTAPSPLVSGPNGAMLGGVACISSDDCWAVGTVQGPLPDLMGAPPPNTEPPLIEHWGGSSWTLLEGLPADTLGDGLTDITCIRPSGDCYAVGADLFYTLTGG